MIMNWIWTGMLVISVICSVVLERGTQLAAAIPLGAQAGIALAFSISGSICLWTGVGKLMEAAGLTRLLSIGLKPILHRLFPSTKHNQKLSESLSGNITANFLGLGNAATPMGIQAVQQMTNPLEPQLATDEMCRLIVLNTASIQLIPSNVAAVRANLGADAPFDILPAVWITSLCSAGLGLLFAWVFGKLWKHG